MRELQNSYISLPSQECSSWGRWRLHPKQLVLVFEDDRRSYEIDLERLRSSAGMLDWIFQVRQKIWATPQVLSDLLAAFRDIFDPQANLCSCAISGGLPEKRITNPTEFLRQRIAGHRMGGAQ